MCVYTSKPVTNHTLNERGGSDSYRHNNLPDFFYLQRKIKSNKTGLSCQMWHFI